MSEDDWHTITRNAAINACEKGYVLQLVLGLLAAMVDDAVYQGAIARNAAINAC